MHRKIRVEHKRCKQSKVSIRTARRMPCRQYDRLSQQRLSFLLNIKMRWLMLTCYWWCSGLQYNFWSQKHRRVELVVLEMYEGNRQSNSTAFSSFHPPPPPIVMRQAYIFPSHISTMATTVTEKGITNKELLCEFCIPQCVWQLINCLSSLVCACVDILNSFFRLHSYWYKYRCMSLYGLFVWVKLLRVD